MTFSAVLWVMLGSALGGMARHWMAGAVGRRVGEGFPWGTLAVNATGATAIGLVAGVVDAGMGPAWLGSPTTWRFAAIGFLGSYTTVSSFSLQTLALVQDRNWLAATAYVAGSVGLCLVGGGLGMTVVSALAAGAPS